MKDLKTACEELVAQGKIEEVFPGAGAYFIGTLSPTSSEFRKLERSYAEAFERRLQERKTKELEALKKHPPWLPF